MRRFQAYFVVSGLLISAGVILLIPPTPLVGARTVTLNPGYFEYLPISVSKAGRLTGSFSEGAGQPLRVYVLDGGQFDSLKTGSEPPLGLFEMTSSSGSISASFQIPGSYFLVIRHGLGIEQTTEMVTLNYKIDGMNITVLGSGVAALVGAGILRVLGSRSRRLERAKIPQARDVVLFDQQRPSQPSPGPQVFGPPPATVPSPQPSAVGQPADSARLLRERLERLEGDLRTMDQMRQDKKPVNQELFEKTYSSKIEEREEIRRKIRSLEPQGASN